MTDDDGSANTLSYRTPLQNFRLELPVMYNRNSFNEGYYIAPYGELGLNSDFKSGGTSTERYRFGVKLGVFF